MRREDLYASRSASPATSHEDGGEDTQDSLRERLNRTLGVSYDEANTPPADADATAPSAPPHREEPTEPQPDDGGISFRLFAPNRKPDGDVDPPEQKIRLSPARGAAFAPQTRPPSFYFAAPPTPAALSRYATVATTPDDLLARASIPWPASAAFARRFPQRILHYTSHPGSLQLLSADATETRKRTRVGKTTRIKRRKAAARLRKKAEEQQRRDAEERARAEEKEAHVRAKKREVNRKKQLRKREKKRAADGGEGPGHAGEGGEAEHSGSGGE